MLTILYRALQFSRWVCLCGSVVRGHHCGDVFASKAEIKAEWQHIDHGAEMLVEL